MVNRVASLPSRQARRVLLVEGQNDKHVVEHVYRKRFKSGPPFAFLDKEGFSRLSESIGPELKAPDRDVVGIIADANDDLTARWKAITDRLRNPLYRLKLASFNQLFKNPIGCFLRCTILPFLLTDSLRELRMAEPSFVLFCHPKHDVVAIVGIILEILRGLGSVTMEAESQTGEIRFCCG